MIATFVDVFMTWADILEVVQNHLELLVMLATVVVFIYLACGVFPKGLSRIFGPCGLTVKAKLRARIACRTSRTTQRVFFEFALLKTQGAFKSPKEWDSILDEFCAYLSKADLESPVIKIPNCTKLSTAEFSDAVGRYFGYLENPRVLSFYSVTKLADYWLTRITITEAYVMPAVLLSGLLARYEDNWETFIAKYISTASSGASGQSRLMMRELYDVFAWLLWGPSREICWQNGWDGLCQISYGDESNSLPAFVSADGDVLGRLRGSLQSKLDAGTFGGLFSVDVDLLPKREFFHAARGHMASSNAYFVDKIAKDSDADFVASITDFQVCEDYRATRYYCTAYIWVLFELDDPEDATFHPETSVAFFEHANLANADTCEFLTVTLFNKAMEHFRMVSEDPATRSRKYRFVCGISREIEHRCRARFAEEAARGGAFGEWLVDSVSFDVRHDPNVVFATIDNYFGDEDTYREFENVELSDRRALADLSVFYMGMYTEAFPKDDERESLPNIMEYIRRSRRTPDWKSHVLLVKDENGVVVGGAVFDYFAKSNSVVIEFIVVDGTQRTHGLGKTLFHEVLKTADADAMDVGFKSADYAFCEVESPAASADKNLTHLHFWAGNWFRRLGFDYVQPALGPDQKPVRDLWFIGLPRGDAVESIPSKIVASAVRDYVHYAMNIADPDGDADFVAMKKQLDARPSVALSPII